MEDLYHVLKMAYADVKVISRQSGMYLCSDKNDREHSILYVNNEVSPRGIDFLSMSLGKSWAGLLYKDRTLDIIDKQTGSIVHTFTNVSSLSKQNIYRDKYSTLTIRYLGRGQDLFIIDNRKARVVAIYTDIEGISVDTRSRYELVVKLHDENNKERHVGITYNMKGVLLNDEA